MFDRRYFYEVVLGILTAFMTFMLIQIIFYLKQYKTIKSFQLLKGHTPHWLFSLILVFILLLELVGRIVTLTTNDGNKHQDILRLTSCVMSIVTVLISLLSYHISERRSKRINILGLLLLWIFLGVVYLIKVSKKTLVSSWQSCPLQVMTISEILVSINCFMLLVIDLISFLSMLRKRGHTISNLEGVEFVHEYCCFLSKISYHWVNKILLKGFKKPLELEDLGLTPRKEDVKIYYNFLKKEIEKEKVLSYKKNRCFSLWRCVWNVSKTTIIFAGMLELSSELLMFVAPICLGLIIDSLKSKTSNSSSPLNESSSTSTPSTSFSVNKNTTSSYEDTTDCSMSVYSFFHNPYVLTVMMFASYMIQIPLKKYYYFTMTREGIRLKAAIQSCIFDKSLSLKMSLVNEGKFINHMAVDAIQLIEFSSTAYFVLCFPIEVIFCFLLLYYQLGKTGALGCTLVFVLVPVQYYLGKYLGNKQDQIMDTADRRLLKTNEMMEHIKLLKMYGWEDLFCERVVRLRSKEISTMWRASIARMIAATMTDGIPSIAVIFTFVLYYYLESNPLTLGEVYSSIVIFMILANQLFFVAFFITAAVKTRTSMQRMGDYFNLPQMYNENFEKSQIGKKIFNKSEEQMNLLSKDSSNWKNNDGVEMSSILDCCNDTMATDEDIVELEGVIKIMNGTFAWHHNPILHDLDFILEKGRLTMLFGSVGSGKSSLLWATLGEMEKLKGDQEFCELPLALVPQRAWIMNASIKDNITFGRPLDEKLYDEVVSFCTLDTDFKLFQDGDATEIGEKGANLSGGQKQRVGLARALYQNADVYLLDDCLSALDPHVAATIFDKVVMRRLMRRGKTVLFVTHNTNLLKHADSIITMNSGSITYQGHPNMCPAGIISQLKADPTHQAKDNVANKLPKVQPSSVLPDKYRMSSLSSTSLNFVRQESQSEPPKKDEVAKLVTEEERQTGSTPIYYPMQYLKHGGIFLITFAFLIYCTRQAAKIFSDYFLGIFIENSETGNLDMHNLVLFCGSLISSIVLVPFSVLAVERFCLNASRNIHNKIIYSLASAPMRFFDTTPLGRILNRMSADLYVLDLVFGSHFDCFLFLITFVIGSFIINGTFNPFFLIPAIPILLLSILLQRFFISSCRELQRLDCTTKSKILSHFSQALSGLHIIRTSGCESQFQNENFEHVNKNNLPLLFQTVCSTWLAFWLDTLGAAIVLISSLSSLFAYNRGYMDNTAAGVAMMYAVCNTYFLYFAMEYLSDIEIYTSNIQRLVEYCDLKSEGDDEDKKPRPLLEWPQSGDLQFRDVSLTYDESLKPVIQDLDLNFPSGFKVGICGRTGSGKSTLTLGLFRLVDICKGEILLDNLDVSSVPIKDLRTRLSIIPQDPVIFSGSIRFNLDPLDTKTDEELWNTLKVSQLYELVFNLPGKLENEISTSGCSMSIGERQLLCLARALLRNSKVLVMDEATASIDQRTDQVIQNIIKSAFKDRTVLTIAHRISTIIHSDWVVVMQGGRLIEEGSPQELLKRKTNFASMVDSS